MRETHDIAGAKNILTIDFTIWDTSVDVQHIQEVAHNLGLTKKGVKIILDHSGVAQLRQAIKQLDPSLVESYHGGSMANIAVQLGKTLRGRGVNITMMTVVGRGEGYDEIMAQYNGAGIRLIPAECDTATIGGIPTSGYSYVIRLNEGERGIGTFSSNMIDFVTPGMITPELIEAHELIILPGTVRQKLGPQLFDLMLKLAWDMDKPVIAPLPTSAYFGWQNHAYFKYMMPSMFVASNIEELAAVLHVDLPTDDNFTAEQKRDRFFMAAYEIAREEKEMECFRMLAHHLKEGRRNILRDTGKSYTPVAFITRGKKGVGIVVAEGDNIEKMMTFVSQQEITITGSSLGAGDNTYFMMILMELIGRDIKKNPGEVGEAAMWMVREKLQSDYRGPRVKDPLKVIESGRPRLLRQIEATYPARERIIT